MKGDGVSRDRARPVIVSQQTAKRTGCAVSLPANEASAARNRLF